MVMRLDSSDGDFEQGFAALLAAKREVSEDVDTAVRDIIDRVRAEGDAALISFSKTFDKIDLEATGIRVSEAEIEAAAAEIDAETMRALKLAHQRICSHHQRQLPRDEHYTDDLGVELGWRWSAVEAVGLYVPGGSAAYPSSVLMNAVPARVAGVKRIVMVVPAPGGRINPLVLAAAKLAGVDEIYRVGGAQAIAALAYGTESIAPVDKITGPGNAFVAAAKRRVFGKVGIDMIAGPSEILVICDGNTDPDWIAMDLFSQAEHDEEAQSILVSPDADFLARVEEAMERLAPTLERETVIRTSMANRGALIQVDDLDQAMEVVNRVCPEHLELSLDDAEVWAKKVRHAGAIFLGRHTPEALGDYCAGPNHVLPTSATSRFSSPLGVYDFQKRSSLIGCSPEGASELGKIASVLSRAESLTAHARSAEMRIKKPL